MWGKILQNVVKMAVKVNLKLIKYINLPGQKKNIIHDYFKQTNKKMHAVTFSNMEQYPNL